MINNALNALGSNNVNLLHTKEDTTSWYWSSSQGDMPLIAWRIDFSSGIIYQGEKYNGATRVRVVRIFE